MSSFKSRQRQMTPYLVFCCVVFLQGALLFGIDTGSFGSLQALPSFLNRFGEVNAAGKRALSPSRTSMMNSFPWIGKILGCLTAEPIIDRLGFKKTAYLIACVQIVAVIIEVTAHHWAQFTVGRMVAYYAVGAVENTTPAYNAEISPAVVRGLLSGSLMLVVSLGNIWGAGMSRAYAKEPGERGWIIPTAMQLIPAIGILALAPFTPESPRWLILKGRKEASKEALDKLRPAHDVQSGATQAEIDTLEEMLQTSTETGNWLDLFRGNYLKRTWIMATLFIFEQTNGNQFVTAYGATFFVQQGLGSMSFTYFTSGQAIAVVACAVGVVLFDVVGRRPPMIIGSALCGLFLFLAGGLGTLHPLTTTQQNTIIACFMLLPAATRISASNTAFLTGAEIGGLRMRRKMMAFGTAIDVTAAFLVTFVSPYLLPRMGVSIAWIFGSVGVFAALYSFLFLPELKGRSLEEVDELFEARLPAWKFATYETTGAGRLLAALENEGKVADESVATVEVK